MATIKVTIDACPVVEINESILGDRDPQDVANEYIYSLTRRPDYLYEPRIVDWVVATSVKVKVERH